jgi:two-component system, cell cycle sensor histidine kinase and response regulator CckA
MPEKPTYEELLKRVKELEESQRVYRALVNDSQDLFYRTDLQGRVVYISPSVHRLSGYTVEEAIGMRMAEDVYLFPEERNLFLAKLQKDGRVTAFESRLKRKDGSIWWASTNAHFFMDTNGNILGIEGITRDISKLKAAEAELKESEEKYRHLFENAMVGIYRTRIEDGKFLAANQTLAKMIGYESVDRFVEEYITSAHYADPALREELINRLRSQGRVDGFEIEMVRPDGSTIQIALSAKAYPEQGYLEGVIVDITALKKMGEELRQAHKMEAIGTLAGGIAHDFNNLLMGIQGHTSLMAIELNPSHPHVKHIHAIEKHIKSAVDLTNQLLGFVRGGKYEVKPVDINKLTLTSAEMFSRTRKELQIHSKTHPTPLVIEADKRQIEQVLLNMFINAWQAMPDSGVLYLETSAVQLDESACNPHQVEPGHYGKISVTDTGIGMEEAIRLQIFDPFFTTKDKDRGTGLGLSSAYGIVKNHGGMITVNSEVGQGSTFNIYLPISDKEVHREVPMGNRLIRGSETILLVDDEEMIIEVGKAMIEKIGYRVVIAKGGEQAIEVISEMGNKIELVILDMIMPGIDGGKTFDRIRKIEPAMPVILASGYTINGLATEIMQRGCSGFIQKPFNISELSQKIRKILDEAKASSHQ